MLYSLFLTVLQRNITLIWRLWRSASDWRSVVSCYWELPRSDDFEEHLFQMIVQPIDYLLIVWFALAALSTVYVAWDQFRNNPEPVVMKWGFILVTLYMGPIGLLLYVLADKEPQPGTHEEFTSPLWKQGVGSTIHCVAGDATGIILAAATTALLGLPMWIDLIVEYLSGFLLGLLVFQSLFMRSMMGGSHARAAGGAHRFHAAHAARRNVRACSLGEPPPQRRRSAERDHAAGNDHYAGDTGRRDA